MIASTCVVLKLGIQNYSVHENRQQTDVMKWSKFTGTERTWRRRFATMLYLIYWSVCQLLQNGYYAHGLKLQRRRQQQQQQQHKNIRMNLKHLTLWGTKWSKRIWQHIFSSSITPQINETHGCFANAHTLILPQNVMTYISFLNYRKSNASPRCNVMWMEWGCVNPLEAVRISLYVVPIICFMLHNVLSTVLFRKMNTPPRH